MTEEMILASLGEPCTVEIPDDESPSCEEWTYFTPSLRTGSPMRRCRDPHRLGNAGVGLLNVRDQVATPRPLMQGCSWQKP